MAARKESNVQEKIDFKWTDNEADLLLTVTHSYKVIKIMEDVDWKSVKTKYDDIMALMKEELPSTADEAKELTKRLFPYKGRYSKIKSHQGEI